MRINWRSTTIIWKSWSRNAPGNQQSIINSMAGRELRMAELKKVIKKLRSQLEEAGMKPVADDR
jgi:hypothetical protein